MGGYWWRWCVGVTDKVGTCEALQTMTEGTWNACFLQRYTCRSVSAMPRAEPQGGSQSGGLSVWPFLINTKVKRVKLCASSFQVIDFAPQQ